MAEKRFFNYQDAILSEEFILQNLGLLEPGRYRGYDTITDKVGLTFSLAHTGSGFSSVDKDLNVTSDKGCLITTQGTIVHHTAKITGLQIDTNSGNANDRIDIIVFEHEYVVGVGGQAGVFSVIKGSLASTVAPAVPLPAKQIKLGEMYIPAGATDLTGITWTPETPHDIANRPSAKLAEINRFTKTNHFNEGSQMSEETTGDGKQALAFSAFDGNSFTYPQVGHTNVQAIEAMPPGSIINITPKDIGSGNSMTLSFAAMTLAETAAGWRSIIPYGAHADTIGDSLTIKDGDTLTLVLLNPFLTGEAWFVIGHHAGTHRKFKERPLKEKVFSGTWDMDTVTDKTHVISPDIPVADLEKIVSVKVSIRRNASDQIYNLESPTFPAGLPSGYWNIAENGADLELRMSRVASSFFDSAGFNAAKYIAVVTYLDTAI